MPQREFWATRHELRLDLSFALNPTETGGAPAMTVKVYDQASTVVVASRLLLPPTIAEEVFLDLSGDVFRTWMLADAEAALKAFQRGHRMWWRIAEEQAQTR